MRPHGALVVALAALLACAPSASTAPTPEDALDISPIVPLPEFTLTSQSGASFGRGDLLGKVWVVDFMFTSCPSVCPMLSARMAEVAKRYARDPDVRFLSISVDPVTDTPAVLTAYATRFGADPARWTWLTGEEKNVQQVIIGGFREMVQRLPAAPSTPEATAGKAPPAPNILHGERFVVVDRDGVIRGYPDPKVSGDVEATVDAVRALPHP